MEPSLQPVRPIMVEEQHLRAMQAQSQQAPAGLGLDDIYYTLFRHKWKIIICTLLGLLSAGIWYVYRRPPYISEAKLFIRYVVVEGMSQRPTTEDTVTKSPDRGGETIINSEEQIITSLDLVKQVAQAIGPEKILANMGGGNDLNAATTVLRNGLNTETRKFSSVITVSFQNRDPDLLQPVLREVISQYLKKHMEIHRAAGMVGDFLTQETDQLRAHLAQTEDELRKAKTKAGVVSIEDAKKAFSEQMAGIRQQIFAAQAELAERSSIVQEFSKTPPKDSSTASQVASVQAAPTNTASLGAVSAVPSSVSERYRGVSTRLEYLQRREQELLIQFTVETPRVREIRTQIAEAQTEKNQLENDYPRLHLASAQAANPISQSPPSPSIDLIAESARITALQAKVKVLNSQLDSIRSEIANLDTLEGNIQELMRKRELEETNYRHYAASLEQSRINEALGSGRVSNISQIQTPSPPILDTSKALKTTASIATSGLLAGLAWAFLIEFVFDRSVRRPVDVEKKLRLPLFLSIPDLSPKKARWFQRRTRKAEHRRLNKGIGDNGNGTGMESAEKSSSTEPSSNNGSQSLALFHETLRDRLIGYFESRHLTHKPKLVAVTGLSKGTGVTTTAAGLASCLSETGDGNVLLVDLTPGQGSAQHFYRGKPVCGIDELLTTRDNAHVQDKLYVVSDQGGSERLSRVLPQRFKHLVPKLKASDFDYIIFDMPPVSQISITPRLAGFMDVVLLVIESERTNLEPSLHAKALMMDSMAHVGVVLNRTKNYVPAFILQESLEN